MSFPGKVTGGNLTAWLDLNDDWVNRCLLDVLKLLPDAVCKGKILGFAFLSMTDRFGLRVARKYCDTCEIILISEKIFPERTFHLSDPKSRFFTFVVLHEIAHAVEQHKSKYFDELPDDVDKKQESDAEAFAIGWFNDHVVKDKKHLPITVEEIEKARRG